MIIGPSDLSFASLKANTFDHVGRTVLLRLDHGAPRFRPLFLGAITHWRLGRVQYLFCSAAMRAAGLERVPQMRGILRDFRPAGRKSDPGEDHFGPGTNEAEGEISRPWLRPGQTRRAVLPPYRASLLS